MSQAFSVESSQELVSPSDCPISHFILCNDTDCMTVIDDSEKYVIDEASLRLNYGTPVERYELFLRAVSVSQVSLTASMMIHICGYETVGLASSGPMSY